ncbi:MAG: 4-hydroxy-tetrahydrodipicolinate synthase [Candidatus Rokubacteria bacterium]|nr:4-hydroxy-tetrahydrodipicolinate synthase [Candidatus Rokubacteria bacterium]
MRRRQLQGSLVAMVTPFRDGRVDEAKIRDLVDYHVHNGTDGLVPCGTTGESPTLSHDEHRRVVDLVIEHAAGRIAVIAGTGSNSTHEAIDLTVHAAKSGADAALLVVPYYNKPTQQGLYEHYKAIAESSDLPLIIYNIPGRTGVNLLPETLARLAGDCRSIVGVKEASGNLEQMSQVILLCGPDFIVLSGDDTLTLPLMAVGGRGVISVIGNFLAKETSEMAHAALEGDWKRAREMHLKLFPVAQAMFFETNPIPVKEAMAMVGMLPKVEYRLPMCPMTEANRARLRKVLVQAGLLKS